MKNDLDLKLRRVAHSREEHWIPLSDLMTGLMMIFMLLAIAYMVKVEENSKAIKQIAILYDRIRNELYQDLEKEFKNDLKIWGAKLDKNLTVRFYEPTILFEVGSPVLKPKFEEILNDFFPRYVSIITSDKYRESIKEVRIEGHTSSEWENGSTVEAAYWGNMDLSHDRTANTLRHVLELPNRTINQKTEWLRKHMAASGLSSSRLVFNKNGAENRALSRRVEFKIITDSESKIAKIIEVANK